MKNLINHFLDYEMGVLHSSVNTDLKSYEIYVADHRNMINPFNICFPFSILENENKTIISVNSSENADIIKKQMITSIQSIENKLLSMFKNSKILRVKQYISSESLISTPLYINLVPLSDFQIQKINEISSVSLDTLKNLNSERKVFALLEDDVPLAYSLITRSSSKWAEISLSTNKLFRSKSLGTQIAQQTLCYIHLTGKNMIYTCETQNIPSIKIAEKLSLLFIHECTIGYCFC